MKQLFERQKAFQHLITGENLPVDNTGWFSYHIQAMIEELGEVLKSDKRWKTHRNTNYEPGNKEEEIADIFIVAINLALFSGFDADRIYETVIQKIDKNFKRYNNK